MEESVKESIDSKKEELKWCTKFWQTPTIIQESPFYKMSEDNAREKDQSKIKGIIRQDFQVFLNKDLSRNDDMEMVISDEAKKEDLEILTD